MESKEVEQAAPTMATLPLQAATQAVQFDPGWYRFSVRQAAPTVATAVQLPFPALMVAAGPDVTPAVVEFVITLGIILNTKLGVRDEIFVLEHPPAVGRDPDRQADVVVTTIRRRGHALLAGTATERGHAHAAMPIDLADVGLEPEVHRDGDQDEVQEPPADGGFHADVGQHEAGQHERRSGPASLQARGKPAVAQPRRHPVDIPRIGVPRRLMKKRQDSRRSKLNAHGVGEEYLGRGRPQPVGSLQIRR